jgi:predicted GIY-YIG superfamily endonuclease/DNA replication protein DnaC
MFHDLLIKDQFPISETPSVLNSRLRELTSEAITQYIEEQRTNLIATTLKDLQRAGFQNLPTVEELMNATVSNPHPWTINLQQHPQQTQESFIEQKKAIETCQIPLNEYISAPSYSPKSVCIVGVPGAGKTTIQQLIIVDALARGLRGAITNMRSERASELGGRHVHIYFQLSTNDRLSVSEQAERAYQKLLKNPKALEFLRQLDFLALDELGEFSTQQLEVLDMVLRLVRNSKMFMGGIIIIATMDQLQMRPIRGQPVLLSYFLLTSFRLARLDQFVRASTDHNLQRIQALTRLPAVAFQKKADKSITEAESEMRQLLDITFNWVDKYENPILPTNAMYIFGKKEPGRKAIDRHIQQMRRKHPTHFIERLAEDMESTLHGEWQPASPVVSQQLTKKLKEPPQLFFYPYARYDITFNKDNCHSQSQLALLVDMPTEDDINHFKPIKIMLAPHGTKLIPANTIIEQDPLQTKQNLIQHGWKESTIGSAMPHGQKLNASMRGKRQQYGLKHRVASTIHSVQGQTLDTVITCIATFGDYALWERNQIVVLLSRTKTGKSMWFVGTKEDIIDAIIQILRKTSKYEEYMNHVLNRLCPKDINPHVPSAAEPPFTVEQQFLPFRPLDIGLPNDNSGFCYLLVSTKEPSYFYIGQTRNIRNRLNMHNSGYNSTTKTAPAHLRPFAVVAYVVGFDHDTKRMREFEMQWVNKQQSLCHLRMEIHADDLTAAAQEIISLWNNQHQYSLRLIITGSVHSNH